MDVYIVFVLRWNYIDHFTTIHIYVPPFKSHIVSYASFLKDCLDRYKVKTRNRFIKISCIIHRTQEVPPPPPSPPTLIMLHLLLKGNYKLFLYIFIEIGGRDNFASRRAEKLFKWEEGHSDLIIINTMIFTKERVGKYDALFICIAWEYFKWTIKLENMV